MSETCIFEITSSIIIRQSFIYQFNLHAWFYIFKQKLPGQQNFELNEISFLTRFNVIVIIKTSSLKCNILPFYPFYSLDLFAKCCKFFFQNPLWCQFRCTSRSIEACFVKGECDPNAISMISIFNLCKFKDKNALKAHLQIFSNFYLIFKSVVCGRV